MRLAFESIIKLKYLVVIPESAPHLQLDDDELNARQYVAGFVLLSVKKAHVSNGSTTIIDRQVESRRAFSVRPEVHRRCIYFISEATSYRTKPAKLGQEISSCSNFL